MRAREPVLQRARAHAAGDGHRSPWHTLADLPRRHDAIGSLFTPRGLADVEQLRSLPALPETADELRTLASVLGGGEGSLRLREWATEREVKASDLGAGRIIAFATHAVVAGELSGMAEPALVLTPPPTASEEDDGLLTASEAARLKLDADLIISSACNTAAPDGTPGAAGLSGLAKAFIYAGSRALLVSQGGRLGRRGSTHDRHTRGSGARPGRRP